MLYLRQNSGKLPLYETRISGLMRMYLIIICNTPLGKVSKAKRPEDNVHQPLLSCRTRFYSS